MGTVALWILALALGLFVAVKKGPDTAATALRGAIGRALEALPGIAVAVLTAGFAGQLIPDGLVAAYIGSDSGLGGVLFAMLIGGMIPGGPMISFPLVVVLNESGAGLVQLVTLLTAWSVFALHRVIIYEIPLMGVRFSLIRLASSLPLPLIAAAFTALLLELFR